MEGESKKTDSRSIIAIVAVVAILLVGGIFVYRRFVKPSSTSSSSVASAAVSGTLDINGVVPSGAVLVLSAQDTSGGSSSDFQTIQNPADQASWTFSTAESGKTYLIVGTLKSSNGAELTKSQPITVTAPATNQMITVNLAGKGLTGAAEVSGVIKVNGYYPTGSTVSLLVKTPNTQFQPTRQGLPAQASTPVSTDKAVAGQEYQVVGYLYDANGTKIGESDILTIDAPAKNEVLVINSSAVAPTPAPSQSPKSKISGTVQLNGVAPSNSRIVILQAPMNSNNFVVAQDNIPAQNGQAWVWTGATNGTWYNMQAVLKQRQSNGTDVDVAVSQQQTVAAPAINVLFTINSGIAPTPSPSPTQ